MSRVGITWLSNWSPYALLAFFSDLTDELSAPTSSHAVTTLRPSAALPQGS